MKTAELLSEQTFFPEKVIAVVTARLLFGLLISTYDILQDNNIDGIFGADIAFVDGKPELNIILHRDIDDISLLPLNVEASIRTMAKTLFTKHRMDQVYPVLAVKIGQSLDSSMRETSVDFRFLDPEQPVEFSDAARDAAADEFERLAIAERAKRGSLPRMHATWGEF